MNWTTVVVGLTLMAGCTYSQRNECVTSLECSFPRPVCVHYDSGGASCEGRVCPHDPTNAADITRCVGQGCSFCPDSPTGTRCKDDNGARLFICVEPQPIADGCVNLPLPTVHDVLPVCGLLAPGNGQSLGGPITSGVWSAVGVVLRPGADGGCPDHAPRLGLTLELAAAVASTTQFSYEATELKVDGGLGTQAGTMEIDFANTTLRFVPRCGTGVEGLTSAPRVYQATTSSLSLDCCRSTVADAGTPLDDPSASMMVFVR